MDHEARARELCFNLTGHCDDLNDGLDKWRVDVIAAALQAERERTIAECAKVVPGAIYMDALEMTAWMGLPEAKRVKYARTLGELAVDALRALAKEGGGK